MLMLWASKVISIVKPAPAGYPSQFDATQVKAPEQSANEMTVFLKRNAL